ncbi:MAG: ribbon-helix-helix domain-containing protein [Candidatus Anammoxibacter sp.]
MHIRFTDIDENFIKSQVHDGFYTNETELVRDAVRRMREENEKKRRFYEAVMRGDEAIERGETVPLTSDLMANIKKRAIGKTKKGEVFNNTDAIPQKTQS